MQFSIIIPFYNEKPESIEATVKSIRETQDFHHQIILIDDGNAIKLHGNLVEKYGCDFLKNEKNLGVGPSRDLGASLAKHNFLAFFDAHVIVERGWDIKARELLETKANAIISPLVKPLVGETYRYGGGWCRVSDNRLFDLEIAIEPAGATPCCYGGAFFIRKSWFDYLRGFAGLVQHGHEEAYLSAKCYGAGGIVLIADFAIRQEIVKRRPKSRYISNSLNRLFINEVLFGIEYVDALRGDIIHLLDEARAKELKKYYSLILSKQMLNTWLTTNKTIEEKIKPLNQQPRQAS